MKHTTTVAGYRTLEGRYALLECLAISGIGKIYRGRDLEQAQSQGMDSRILIHLLPASLNKLPLETLFQQISQTHKQAGHDWIMPPRTFGQDEDSRYIVMDSPVGQAVTSFVRLAGDGDNLLSRQLCRQLQPLHQKGCIKRQVDPALVVASAENHFYLLATAFSPDIQALQSLSQPLTIRRKTIHMLVAGLSLGFLSAISALAASYIFDSGSGSAPTAYMAEPEELPPPPPVQLASLAPQMGMSSLAMVNSDRSIGNASVNLLVEGEPVKQGAPEAKPAITHQPKPVVVIQAKPDAAKAAKSQSRQAEAKLKSPDKAGQKKTSAKMAANRQIEAQRTSSEQEVEPPGFDKLVQLAETAMSAGHYGSGSNGALYYTRLVRSQSRLHPQVKRLSQAIVSHYHQQARAALLSRDIDRAGQLLEASMGIIKEFNLGSLNGAQAILEHKAAALQ
ncbi:MAG: hypothetical protein KJ914_11825 [Gammaproteobacteria bacterium]|nr:hypothetical protein [Gammaproteobacteria bacterium]MBU1723571.1 hypothetical protein [Gammaproteobacteria bacterium]MBU2004129.1 hypothetical protein [Gammaproteobacteria bacterium]